MVRFQLRIDKRIPLTVGRKEMERTEKAALLWRSFLPPLAKVVNSISRIFKSALLTKVSLVKAMVFPVVMYGCESWTIERAEQ